MTITTPTNREFLAELAKGADYGEWLWVCSFAGSPGSGNWAGQPYREGAPVSESVDGWGGVNSYFSVASLRTIEHQVARKKQHFGRLLALVIDDTDPDGLAAPPSWVLATSPGKSQVGWFLEGEDAANEPLCTLLITRMVSRGLLSGDRSGNNVVRYVRLPVGENQKARPSGNFAHRMIQWSPQVRYSLEDAAGAIGIDLDELRAELAAGPASAGRTGLAADLSSQDRVAALTQNIVAGVDLHDSINQLAAMKVGTGQAPGAVVNELRGLMSISQAPRDERWHERWDDIVRSVDTAVSKWKPAPVYAEPEEVQSQQASQDFPAALLQPGGALQDFMDWTMATAPRPQPILALSSALSCLATALGRQVAGETGLRTNLYLVSVADTGTGKEHGRKCVDKALTAAGLDRLIGGDELASSSGLISRLQEQPNTLIQPDEYGLELQAMKAKGASAHKAALMAVQMKLFGLGDSVYRGTEYADKKLKARQDITNPCLNINATTTAAELHPALGGRDMTSGFLNRLLMFFLPPGISPRQMVGPKDPPPALVEWLRAANSLAADGMGNLGAITGVEPPVIRLSAQARRQVEDLYEWVDEQFVRGKADGMDTLYSRFVEHAWKLAIVKACSQYSADDLTRLAADGGLEIDFVSMDWGICLAKHLVAVLEEEIRGHMGESDFDRTRVDVLRVIQRAGAKGLTRRELGKVSRAYRALKPREQDEVTQALLVGGDAMRVDFTAVNGKVRECWVAAGHEPKASLGGNLAFVGDAGTNGDDVVTG